jgi:SPP1 family predicted phage head-tail adaptor
VRGRAAVAEIGSHAAINDFDGTGGDWESFAQCYADIRPLRGRELFDAQQVQAHVTHAIETEFIYGVTAAMKVRVAKPELVNEDEPDAEENFRFFNIETVINVNEANRSLELLCTEKV